MLNSTSLLFIACTSISSRFDHCPFAPTLAFFFSPALSASPRRACAHKALLASSGSCSALPDSTTACTNGYLPGRVPSPSPSPGTRQHQVLGDTGQPRATPASFASFCHPPSTPSKAPRRRCYPGFPTDPEMTRLGLNCCCTAARPASLDDSPTSTPAPATTPHLHVTAAAPLRGLPAIAGKTHPPVWPPHASSTYHVDLLLVLETRPQRRSPLRVPATRTGWVI